MFTDLTENSARVSDCDDVRRDIPCDHTARTYHGVVAYRDTRSDDGTRTYPAVSAYPDRKVILICKLTQTSIG